MFIGHYAPALVAAAHPKAPRLGALFLAAQFIDIFFFTFVLTGVEHMRIVPGFTAMSPFDLYDMRFTHSALGTLGFAALWAVVTRVAGGSWPAAWIGAAVVASHWLLDLLVHAPDLTLLGIGRRYGFALWNEPMAEMPLELALTFGALAFWAARARSRDWRGRLSLALLTMLLIVFQLMNWLEAKPTRVLDPVPASIPLTALAAYAILAAAAWWAAATRDRAGPRVASL